MGNARTQSKIAGKDKRALPALPDKLPDTGNEALHQLQSSAGSGQQTSETLVITIPCKTGVPDRVTPIYITRTNPDGTISGRWLCFYCRRSFFRRKPCTSHMGLIPDHKHNCPVLYKEEENRRQKEFV